MVMVTGQLVLFARVGGGGEGKAGLTVVTPRPAEELVDIGVTALFLAHDDGEALDTLDLNV